MAKLTTAINGRVRSHRTHKGVRLAHARIAGNFAEALVSTQVLHKGRISDTTVITVIKHRNVALTKTFNNVQKVCLYVELVTLRSEFCSGISIY